MLDLVSITGSDYTGPGFHRITSASSGPTLGALSWADLALMLDGAGLSDWTTTADPSIDGVLSYVMTDTDGTEHGLMFVGAGFDISDRGRVYRGSYSYVLQYTRDDSGFHIDYAVRHPPWSAANLGDAIRSDHSRSIGHFLQGSFRGNDSITLGEGDDRLGGNNGRDTIFGLGGDDSLYGGKSEDWLYGGTGDDVLRGNGGGDFLFGGMGQDVMWGSGGGHRGGREGHDRLDHFRFLALEETGATAETADLIVGFSHDRIELCGIDASSLRPGNNRFAFLGTGSASTSIDGAVTYEIFNAAGTANDYTLIYLDTDADPEAEAMIRLTGLHSLTAADFML